jgi:hypothetical protein
MIVSTTSDLPGYQIEEVLGEVFGLVAWTEIRTHGPGGVAAR